MHETSNILISVDDRHVGRLLSGEKMVELRRRPVRVSSGCRVWIYSKVPRGELRALGIVARVFFASPEKIWDRYGSKTGISLEEFFAYFSGVREGCAIIFEKVYKLHPAISLRKIQNAIKSFRPPQFFKLLKDVAFK